MYKRYASVVLFFLLFVSKLCASHDHPFASSCEGVHNPTQKSESMPIIWFCVNWLAKRTQGKKYMRSFAHHTSSYRVYRSFRCQQFSDRGPHSCMSRWVSTSSTPPLSGDLAAASSQQQHDAKNTPLTIPTLDSCTTRVLGRGRWLELREIAYQMPTGGGGGAEEEDGGAKAQPKTGKWEFVRRTTSHQRADVPRPTDDDAAAAALPDAVEMIVTVRVAEGSRHDEYLLVVKQYRPPVDAFCVEFPAGLVDAHETDAAAPALRELAEEAGVLLGPTRSDPGVIVEKIHVVDASPAVAYEPGMSASTCSLVRISVDISIAEKSDATAAAAPSGGNATVPHPTPTATVNHDAASSSQPRWLRALCAQRELESTELDLEVLALPLQVGAPSSAGDKLGEDNKPLSLLEQLRDMQKRVPARVHGDNLPATAVPPTRVDAKLWAFALARGGN
jgi:8-oxo-dGTP pyrophosphatase MutT (NUDIX family)